MDKEEVESLKSDDRLRLKAIYNSYRAEFLGFGKRYNLDQDALADVYQEAFLALRKHAISGRLDSIQSSMKTYLFGIGKYKIFDILKEKNHNVPYEANLHIVGEEVVEIELDEAPLLTQEQVLLRKYFKMLGETCQRLLTFFYYRGLTIKEIVMMGDYKDENSVKSSKSRCVKQLREMIKN